MHITIKIEHSVSAEVTSEHVISAAQEPSISIVISYLPGAASELPEVPTERAFKPSIKHSPANLTEHYKCGDPSPAGFHPAFKGAAERAHLSGHDILSELDVYKGESSGSRRRRQPGQPSTPPRAPRRGKGK